MTVYLGTETLPLATLLPFPGNARVGNLDKIRESVRKHGQYRALIIRRTPTGDVILAGNHTAQAMIAEGFTEARCEVHECEDNQAIQINLADNKIPDDGQYNDEALLALLEELEGEYDGTGYGIDDVEDLMATLGQMAETPFFETQAAYAETDEELQARQDAANGQALSARGIRETIIVLPQDLHDELHELIARCRTLLTDKDVTNGEVVLKAMRALIGSLV